jgi:uncharacterized surface protein with fasciclin (FAS1) repeats
MFRSLCSGFYRATALLFIATAPFLASCTKNDTVDPNPVTPPGSGTTTTPGTSTTSSPGSNTITVVASVSYIAQNNSLNILEAAILRAGLTDEFNKSNITIFAPSDDAFKAAGYADASAINAVPVADLQRILRNHIVNSRIDRSAMPTAVNTTYQTTLTNSTISVYKTSLDDISVNNGKITQGDNPTAGSVVHIISRLLIPASVSLTDLVKSNTNLSFLAAAIARADAATQAAINATSSTGMTLFAPTNDAFKAAGYADVAAIQAASQATISNLLLYHVLKFSAYSQTFQNGADLATAQGTTIRTNVSSGKVTILGKGNGTSVANVTTADQVASNGVLHVIDRVLMPQ